MDDLGQLIIFFMCAAIFGMGSTYLFQCIKSDRRIELNRCKVSGYMPTDWDRRCKAINMAIEALNCQKDCELLPEISY